MRTAAYFGSLKLRSAIRVACVIAAGAIPALGIVACGSSTSTSTSSGTATTSTTSSATKPASPEALRTALLTPANVGRLGVGLPTLTAKVEDSSTYSSIGAGEPPSITFISGDPACKQVLAVHPVQAAAWATVSMKPTSGSPEQATIGEDIESFADPSKGQQIMQENRSQLANCHRFVGEEANHVQYTFTHSTLAIPPMGDEMVTHQVTGEAQNGVAPALASSEVEIRSGSDVIFVFTGLPATPGSSNATAKIADSALKKYQATAKTVMTAP